jgi:hypothetical protein
MHWGLTDHCTLTLSHLVLVIDYHRDVANCYDDAFGVNGGARETAKRINFVGDVGNDSVTSELQSFNFRIM